MLNEKVGRIQSPKIIRIGGGVAQETAEVLKQLGLSRPLIVTDKNLLELGHVDLVLAILEKHNITSSIFDGVVEDPTDQCVDAGLEVFNCGSFDLFKQIIKAIYVGINIGFWIYQGILNTCLSS